MMNVGAALAAAVSPLVAGYVIDKTKNWDLPFLGSIGLLLFGAITAYWMNPKEPLPSTELGTVSGSSGLVTVLDDQQTASPGTILTEECL